MIVASRIELRATQVPRAGRPAPVENVTVCLPVAAGPRHVVVLISMLYIDSQRSQNSLILAALTVTLERYS
jgi:hypothetical protein